MTEIKIIDEIMGSGKTTSAIDMINESKYKRFIFITPYLDEVKRILKSCKEKDFVEPKGKTSKLSDVKKLIGAGKNIVTTHALFKMFDKSIIELLKHKSYTLVIDETVETTTVLEVGDDLDIIRNMTERGEGSLLRWKNKKYKGAFSQLKSLSNKGELAMTGNSLLRIMSPDIFKAFKKIYVLTYMFEGQVLRSYFDYWKMPYSYESVGAPPQYEYDKLLRVCDNDKMNAVGEDIYSLSVSWYEHNTKGDEIEALKNNVYNFFRHIVEVRSEDAIWTVFKKCVSLVKGKGFSKGFVPINERATNEYRNRTACAYLVNRFANPAIKNFYEENGVSVNEDAMALSEMLQWIWRSAIRDGKPIDIYIPSKRMRELLKKWIVENSRKEITT